MSLSFSIKHHVLPLFRFSFSCYFLFLLFGSFWSPFSFFFSFLPSPNSILSSFSHFLSLPSLSIVHHLFVFPYTQSCFSFYHAHTSIFSSPIATLLFCHATSFLFFPFPLCYHLYVLLLGSFTPFLPFPPFLSLTFSPFHLFSSFPIPYHFFVHHTHFSLLSFPFSSSFL